MNSSRFGTSFRFSVFAGALSACLFAATPSGARQTQMGLDVTAIGLLPIGSYKDGVGPGMGLLGGLETEISPGVGLTVRSGYITHMERGDYVRNIVPVLGGFKLTTYSSSIYLAAEAGRAWVHRDYRGDNPLLSDGRNTKTAWGVGVGSASDVIDLRISWYVWDAAHMGESMTLGLSLGFLLFGS